MSILCAEPEINFPAHSVTVTPTAPRVPAPGRPDRGRFKATSQINCCDKKLLGVRPCRVGNKQACKIGLKWVRVEGPLQGGAGHSRGSQGGGTASHRGGWPGQSGQPVPRLQAGLGRAKVRGPGHPCPRGWGGQVQAPGSRGRGPSDAEHGPRSPDECPRSPEPPHSAACRCVGRPAGPPTRGSPQSRRRRASHRQARAHLGPGERLCGSCTRGVGVRVGRWVPGAGMRLGEDEEERSSARPAPRWPPRRPAATSPPRPVTPRHAPRPAPSAPPRTHPGLARCGRRPQRSGPPPPARPGSKLST